MTAQRSSSPGDEAPKSQRGKERFAALHGLVEAFRRIPAAFRRPETLMLCMAIFASFGAHMPPYLGLGALADYWAEQEEARKAAEPVEVNFEWNEPAEPEQPEAKQPPEKPEPTPKKKRDAPEKKAKVAEKQEEPKPKPEEKKRAEIEVEPPPSEPPPPSQQRKQSVTQKSEEPDEPPPDARFLAEQSRRVEEESVAMVRDEVRDDPEPEAAAPEDRGVDEAGDEDEKVDSFNERGRDEGEKFVESRTPQPPERAQDGPAESHAPGREERAEQAEVEQSTPAPGTVIKDPMGSFTIATAEEPQERQRAQTARSGGRAGPRGEGKPDLAVNWRTFQDTYDEDTLERERTPQRRTNIGSSERNKRWKEFRAAIENYVSGVKPGNTTALNAAADPFAAYIAAFHRHLHNEFAYQFLGGLPATGELSDPSLVTKVEMVINPDGTLEHVGVVRSSGQMMFDFGAYNAVKGGEPYPRPPEGIRSADGKVYLRWALHRNHSQCGTWNAEPFILKNPPDTGSDGMVAPPGMQLGPTRRGPG